MATSTATHAPLMTAMERVTLVAQTMPSVMEAVIKAAYQVVPDPAGLLRQPFTLRELQEMHELVLGEPVARQNFRHAMLASGMLTETGTRVVRTTGKPAMTYTRTA